jgi:hypothetical protein
MEKNQITVPHMGIIKGLPTIFFFVLFQEFGNFGVQSHRKLLLELQSNLSTSFVWPILLFILLQSEFLQANL